MIDFEPYRNLIVFVSVAIYMAMCIGVGLWALRRTKSTKDFFMAGRDLGVMVTALAVFSSTLSGFGFVGGPGLVYRMGISSLWMIVCTSIGYSLSFFLLGKRIRLFAEIRETVSLPDAVAARYNSETTRFFTAVALVLGVFGYLGTQILAMATVLKDILANIAWLPTMELHVCMSISVAVLVFYCVTGGIVASVYTDMVQGGIMVVAAMLVFAAAIFAVDGGMMGTATTIMRDDPEAMSPWGTLGIMGCLSWYFLFALGGAGQPHVITKLMMNKRIADAKHILPVSVIGYSLSALLWISIGLAMRALVLQGDHPELASADDAAPQFLRHYAHPLLAGIVFAGLFAAIMSTADGFLNIGAAAVVHDIPKALGIQSIRNELMWARIATLII
ncbi:MAG: sodium/proline symporter, partial [Pirellulaceae bacterium]|nr:sodium/proline symporter [Pirellulaceae bacterium]